MIIQKVTHEDLEQALIEVNKKYENNITWNNFLHIGNNAYRVTLKCKDSKKAGHRLGFCTKKDGTHRRLISACWHVHGDFFDCLLDINPKARIKAVNRYITIDGGNWEDRNIGSMKNPLYFSEACECE